MQIPLSLQKKFNVLYKSNGAFDTQKALVAFCFHFFNRNSLFQNKKHRPRCLCIKNSALNARLGARTLDTLIKSQVLYQLS